MLGPMTKVLYSNKKLKKKLIDNTKTPPKIEYTTFADRLRTISWSNKSHPTGVVKSECNASGSQCKIVEWRGTRRIVARCSLDL